nr:MAG TPA: hypothetical protein [Caudoviricetes sp.]
MVPSSSIQTSAYFILSDFMRLAAAHRSITFTVA